MVQDISLFVILYITLYSLGNSEHGTEWWFFGMKPWVTGYSGCSQSPFSFSSTVALILSLPESLSSNFLLTLEVFPYFMEHLLKIKAVHHSLMHTRNLYLVSNLFAISCQYFWFFWLIGCSRGLINIQLKKITKTGMN